MLGGELVGIYLHGSLALGDFDSAESDVDFLVATETEVAGEALERLAALHVQLGDRLDGSYLPRDVFRRHDLQRTVHPHIEAHKQPRLAPDDHGGETVIYRYVLLKCGVAVYGPPPRELIEPVDPEQLRWGVRDVLENWWEPMLARPNRLQEEQYRGYAVVTMCRVRFTLACGDVVSKPAAARWALEHVDGVWHRLIACAAARDECGYDETVAFIRETLAVARSSASASSIPRSRGGV